MVDAPEATADTIDMSDAVEYNADTETYRAPFDGRTESIPTAIISMVATVTETDPLELEPLYSVVDPDALDALMTSGTTTRPDGDIRVTFTLDGHEITVHSYGMMRVAPEAPTDT